MAIVNGYATLAELNARFGFTLAADTTRDGILEAQVEAASRWIDRFTGRQFYAASATRYFTAQHSHKLRLLYQDLLSITTLKTDYDGDRTYETTWASTDYDLEPFNLPPYQWIEVSPQGLNAFPSGMRKGVEIVGSWGYAATAPDEINEACILKAAQLFKRRIAGGAGGNATLGSSLPTSDKVIEDLITSYRRRI